MQKMRTKQQKKKKIMHKTHKTLANCHNCHKRKFAEKKYHQHDHHIIFRKNHISLY